MAFRKYEYPEVLDPAAGACLVWVCVGYLGTLRFPRQKCSTNTTNYSGAFSFSFFVETVMAADVGPSHQDCFELFRPWLLRRDPPAYVGQQEEWSEAFTAVQRSSYSETNDQPLMLCCERIQTVKTHGLNEPGSSSSLSARKTTMPGRPNNQTEATSIVDAGFASRFVKSVVRTPRWDQRVAPIADRFVSSGRDDALQPRRKTCLKRRRSLSDVDGPNTGILSHKKRRLRRFLITSRLSQPFSQPATHIINRESAASDEMRLLKLAAIMNAKQSVRLVPQPPRDLLLSSRKYHPSGIKLVSHRPPPLFTLVSPPSPSEILRRAAIANRFRKRTHVEAPHGKRTNGVSPPSGANAATTVDCAITTTSASTEASTATMPLRTAAATSSAVEDGTRLPLPILLSLAGPKDGSTRQVRSGPQQQPDETKPNIPPVALPGPLRIQRHGHPDGHPDSHDQMQRVCDCSPNFPGRILCCVGSQGLRSVSHSIRLGPKCQQNPPPMALLQWGPRRLCTTKTSDHDNRGGNDGRSINNVDNDDNNKILASYNNDSIEDGESGYAFPVNSHGYGATNEPEDVYSDFSVLFKSTVENVEWNEEGFNGWFSMALPLGLPPVRILRPTIWCIAAVGTIYCGCAAYEVRHDAAIAKQARARRSSGPGRVTLQELDAVRAAIAASSGRNPFRTPSLPPSSSPSKLPSPSPTSVLLNSWTGLPEPGKLMAGFVSTNLGVFALERLLPGTATLFSHLPAATGSNFTMLTSAFGHVGFLHLALNMYGLVQFLPPVAYSQTFTGSGSHLAAFYLSAGVLSAYAFHLAAVWPRPLDRVVPARGASGAVMAIVGAFGTSYPDQRLGIVLIPGSLPASQFLLGLALFETYGLFVGFKRLPLAHAAHLAGLAIGFAYVHFDARNHVWKPARQWAFRRLRQLKML
ncbi:Peptidase S54, rhomboid domain protein [Niveomyces insectorum RCEF 264]|uniref:Peptidase S54, rhomboid domain protein n=1 Tax=Niveomyces insectorum RCEF 264 TaxID=1081102 RepID=A0A167ZRG1_9HYPO|nr:Peptidase S54, rhomboid domain protein [Niveomyces insectorum RCEF 264]